MNPNSFKSVQFPRSAIEKKKEWVRSREDREGKRKERILKGRQEKERVGEEVGKQISFRQHLFPGNYIVTNQRTL